MPVVIEYDIIGALIGIVVGAIFSIVAYKIDKEWYVNRWTLSRTFATAAIVSVLVWLGVYYLLLMPNN